MNIFYYEGNVICDYSCMEVTYPQIGSNYYTTMYIEVNLLYGNFAGGSALPPTGNLPPFPEGVPLRLTLNHASSWSNPCSPLAVDSTPISVVKVDLWDQSNPRNCLGAKYICISRTFPQWTMDTNPYTLVWAIDTFTIPYGRDQIVIAPQSGNSPPIGPDY